jgi:hypothetical protein
VYQDQLFFAGKDRVAMFWISDRETICPSRVAMFLAIRNEQPTPTTITALTVETLAQGKWINLPIMGTTDAAVLWGGKTSALRQVRKDNFIDVKLVEFHSIPAGELLTGWLLLDYPADEPIIGSGDRPLFRVVIADHDVKKIYDVRQMPQSLLEVRVAFDSGDLDMSSEGITQHCGHGLIF